MSAIVFDDVIEVKDINADGQHFEKVSRIECHSENYDMSIHLDVNTHIYPIQINERFGFALATSISANVNEDEYWNPNSGPSLADGYEYVMYGTVFKYELDESDHHGNISIIASFGGLLMKIMGDANNLNGLALDAKVYLLMRKIN